MKQHGKIFRAFIICCALAVVNKMILKKDIYPVTMAHCLWSVKAQLLL
ncbi:hypothetical protein B4086_3398 [Bacillus cereus]|nr:hypothetical protein B4086_3398 [Bacillus cereus]KLA18629.1 hypothetical protein B4078_3197 [Bacillus cereus]KZD57074.1 hypothetical protein B4085_0419 [Bacillus cereus]KZD68921.1 hypothetical protein B4116_0586 [Bacillus cereus]